jgi:transposase
MKEAEAVPVSGEQMEALLRRVESRQLLDSDFALLSTIVITVQRMALVLSKKRTSIARLKKMLFGARTEKTETVVGTDRGQKDPKATGKGHGRRRRGEYWGARHQTVPHRELAVGQRCPECARGTLYQLKAPSVQMWFTAVAPIQATALECQRLRCSGCGTLFTASPPAEAAVKYDESVGSIIALLRFGNGMPHFRLAQFQRAMGVPLPPSVQWALVRRKAERCGIVIFKFLYHLAAQGLLMLLDDTRMKIMQNVLRRSTSMDIPLRTGKDHSPQGRKGTCTTGIVSTTGQRQIVLYATGSRHAGENMDQLLSQRAAGLPAPIQMCDALPQNLPKQFQVILANCNAHARRRFVDLADDFAPEVDIVLHTFQCLYANDEAAMRLKLSPQERLAFHRLRSAFLMEGLRDWMNAQMEKKKVEPNSALGEAFGYYLKHWTALTLFVREPGAPLDNNGCERILKRAITHRKNSLFYKTVTGAQVGDIFMSIIATCILNKANPFHYLTELEKHAEEVQADPEGWLPWNYLQRLNSQSTASVPA